MRAVHNLEASRPHEPVGGTPGTKLNIGQGRNQLRHGLKDQQCTQGLTCRGVKQWHRSGTLRRGRPPLRILPQGGSPFPGTARPCAGTRRPVSDADCCSGHRLRPAASHLQTQDTVQKGGGDPGVHYTLTSGQRPVSWQCHRKGMARSWNQRMSLRRTSMVPAGSGSFSASTNVFS